MVTEGNGVKFAAHPDEPMPASDDTLDVQLTREHFKDEIREAITKGTLRHATLVRRFANPDCARLTKAYVSEVVLEVQAEMVADYADHNPQMELLGYLAQGDMLLQNLNSLLDSNLDAKEHVAVIAAIQSYWEKRIGFLKYIGAFNQLLDPSKPNRNMLQARTEEYTQGHVYADMDAEAAEYEVLDAAGEPLQEEEAIPIHIGEEEAEGHFDK